MKRYLERRQLPGPWRLEGSFPVQLRGAVVIPALAEEQELPQTLARLAANPAALRRRWLVVVVVNQTAAATPEQKAENQRCLAWLRKEPPPGLNLGLVDAATTGLELPRGKGGVGLARKIGADLALPWLDGETGLLVCLDADTWVEPDYLAAIEAHFEAAPQGGAVIPYRHREGATAPLDRAVRDYELYLRGHQFGLKWAGSPYAYATIGSTIACRIDAYVQAGGMNSRKAGEDFYFLQQLAKTVGVATLAGTLVHPSARLSARTPFGTGPALQEALEQGRPRQALPAAAFLLLRRWLGLVSDQPLLPAAELLRQAAGIAAELGAFLEQNRFVPTWERISLQHAAPAARLRAFHEWFDALKGLRLLHYWLDQGRARVAPEVAVAELFALAGEPACGDADDQLQRLRRLQGAGEGSSRLAAGPG